MSCKISYILDFSDCMLIVSLTYFFVLCIFCKLEVRSKDLSDSDFVRGSFIGGDVYSYQEEHNITSLFFFVIGHRLFLPIPIILLEVCEKVISFLHLLLGTFL